MPSSTPKQAAFMRAVAHSPQFAEEVGVPQKVGQEFSKADQLAKAALIRKGAKPKGPPQ